MVLDNKDRSAPAQFNDSEQIEISRRINRGHGSTYRVNGKEVRARDVQLLFADVASGPHSTAMVSQGRVGALINAKPTQRRGLLEEAAGITGLHSRRHEAELRLRAAETNLERLDDVVITLEAQLQGLKKQARQATRYKNVNMQIRRSFCIEVKPAGAPDGILSEPDLLQIHAKAQCLGIAVVKLPRFQHRTFQVMAPLFPAILDLIPER